MRKYPAKYYFHSMRKNQKNVETVSFVHIGEDIIVPSHELNRNKTITFIAVILYCFFGSIWVIACFAWGIKELSSWFAFLISFGIPTVIVLNIRNMNWFEINRKDGTIKCWANKMKKKLIQIINKDGFKVFHDKVTTSAEYGTRQYKIYFQANDSNLKKRYELFTLPKGIPDCIAFQLTKEVSKFLSDFLNNKPVKLVNKQYTFTYHI